MTDDDAAYFVLGHTAVQHQTKGHQDPWEIRGREYQEAQEAEPRFRVAARPDIDKATAQGGAEERDGEEGGKAEENGDGVEEEPGELRGRVTGGFFE